ncbi:MAG: hypothetical protein VCD50_08095 [Alphaproteobacteria bacterium]
MICHVPVVSQSLLAARSRPHRDQEPHLLDRPHDHAAGRRRAESVYLQHTTNGEAIVCEQVDTLVTALGQQSETALEAELEGWGGEVLLAGDCLSPRTAEEAVLEGIKAGVAV